MRVFIFFFLIAALTSCEQDNLVRKVSIKKFLSVIPFECDKIIDERIDLFTSTTVINSQEELIKTFNTWGIKNCDEMNEIDYEENTLLVRFFYSFNFHPISSVKQDLYYHNEEKYYEYYLQLKSPSFRETDKMSLYYTGILIRKIDDSYIKTSIINIIGK